MVTFCMNSFLLADFGHCYYLLSSSLIFLPLSSFWPRIVVVIVVDEDCSSSSGKTVIVEINNRRTLDCNQTLGQAKTDGEPITHSMLEARSFLQTFSSSQLFSSTPFPSCRESFPNIVGEISIEQKNN